LLEYGPFRKDFKQDQTRQILLHITGPTPIEHQKDLETVLHAYRDMMLAVPEQIATRIFLAFSVGNEDHPSFRQAGWKRMTIEDIYRMASAVVFPSETEGRGLPIVEASASMVPLICSRYQPEQVFADVVGEGLPADQQIQYTLFPEADFSETFLHEVSDLLLRPHTIQNKLQHNREAVRQRYSSAALEETVSRLLEAL
jgi:glycosyltransferase involved in cell wall biosynthesis